MDKIDKFINNIADEIANQAKQIAPVDTGNLKDDIRVWHSRGGKKAAYIGNTLAAPYAKFVHYGTKPHVIKAKDKKVLANVKLDKVYGKRVFHPGTKANPYLLNAANDYFKSASFKKAQDRFIKDLEDEIFNGINFNKK